VNRPVALLVLLNFLAIASLPRVFFRRGRFNARWLATAAPFAGCAVLLVLAALGVVPTWPGSERAALDAAAVLSSAASLSLIWLTVGTHRVRLALWHQDDDAPEGIVTWGPYARVRHPFYTAFLLAMLAAALAAPGPASLAVLCAGAAAMGVTARREERRLLASDFGASYRDYMRTTGRFVPMLGRRP
jgi:protein-S-isoprenylcysteine O-methyltransferase Ste14